MDKLEDVAAEARRMLLAVPVPVHGSELPAAQLREALQILERAQSSLLVIGQAQKAALRRIFDAFKSCYQRVLLKELGPDAPGVPESQQELLMPVAAAFALVHRATDMGGHQHGSAMSDDHPFSPSHISAFVPVLLRDGLQCRSHMPTVLASAAFGVPNTSSLTPPLYLTPCRRQRSVAADGGRKRQRGAACLRFTVWHHTKRTV